MHQKYKANNLGPELSWELSQSYTSSNTKSNNRHFVILANLEIYATSLNLQIIIEAYHGDAQTIETTLAEVQEQGNSP